jgi:hypothetical protein
LLAEQRHNLELVVEFRWRASLMPRVGSFVCAVEATKDALSEYEDLMKYLERLEYQM